MAMTITDRFIASMEAFAAKELPEAVIQEAKLCMVDYVACANIGATLLKEQNQAYLDTFAGESGEVLIVGTGKTTTMLQAAMLNGINSHMIELDDGHRYAMLHLAAPVISVMLSAAKAYKLTVDQLLKGIVVGYEATIRLASAIQPGHKLKGFHATGTCGTIGSAMGLAVALGYTGKQLKCVVSAASTDAAGILQMIDEGSQLKPYNIGRAAVAAINAVAIGATGLVGPIDPLGGKRGFFKMAADEVKENYLVDGFLPDYAIQKIYRKPYAACRHCHACIEATLNICRDTKIDPDKIDTILVETYGLAVKGHEHKDIQGASSAKMSTPYGVAAAVLYDQVNYEQYETACLEDERLLALAQKVEVVESEDLSALVPAKRAAIVKLTADGKTYENRVDYPKGEPENPILPEELEEKYYSLMKAAGKDEAYSQKVLDDIYHIEDRFEQLLNEL